MKTYDVQVTTDKWKFFLGFWDFWDRSNFYDCLHFIILFKNVNIYSQK